MGNRRAAPSLALLWQAPLAMASFLLHLLGTLAYRLFAPRPETLATESVRWRPQGPCSISGFWDRFRLHLNRPHWDAHATVAHAGPFPVEESLNIQIASAACSARTWQLLVWRIPAQGSQKAILVERIIGADHATNAYWKKINLTPGNYEVETRYYGGERNIELPCIEVDARWTIPHQETSKTIGELYYDALVDLEGLLSKALHYHIAIGLRYGRLHPASKPHGSNPWLSPGRSFAAYRSGALARGEALQVDIDPRAYRFYDLYLTLYGVGGLPTTWQRLHDGSILTGPRQKATSYLIQMHRRGAEEDPLPELLLTINHLKGLGSRAIRRVEHLA